jgi:probable blue pigment (indigoidine) exporter
VSGFLDPTHLINTFGLAGMMLILFAECGLLIGFFLPGDSLLFTGGLLIADGLIAPLWLALILLPVAAIAEEPPSLDGEAVLGFAYVTFVTTALAFAAWFAGLRHLDAGTVGLVGLLNPVTGVLLGTVVAAEALTARQIAGLALVLAGIVIPHVGRRPVASVRWSPRSP